MAATAPYPADLQSRAVPAARTMVVASTASTAEARNTARNSAPALISSTPSVAARSAAADHARPAGSPWIHPVSGPPPPGGGGHPARYGPPRAPRSGPPTPG